MIRRPLPFWRWWKPVPAIAGLALAAFAMLLVPGLSEGRSNPPEPAAVANPVATALPGPCLLPAPEMRRQHMEILFEERTQAVRHGVRDPEASLTRCVACHAVHDDSGQPVSYADERHFCRACHMRVAVAPDCFSCHRSTPAAPDPAEEKP